MQLINIIFNLALFLEVLFLFTCGQRYMKLAVLRNRRNFQIERWTYLLIGIWAFSNAILSTSVDATELMLKASVMYLIFRKCITANAHYKQVKDLNNERKV